MSNEWETVLVGFFEHKSRHDVEATMSFFSRERLAYVDAVFGIVLPYDGLKAVYSEHMPKWPKEARSYPVRILSGKDSAFIEFVDTEEMFGAELRAFALANFEGDKIARWSDYWDGNAMNADLYNSLRVPQQMFPSDFHEGTYDYNPSSAIGHAARALNEGLGKRTREALGDLLTADSTLEDRVKRLQLVGRAAICEYFSGDTHSLPYTRRTRIRHVVGGDAGGAFEWISDAKPVTINGVTALELEPGGRITRISTVYDGRLTDGTGVS
jgi:hypothetical protein